MLTRFQTLPILCFESPPGRHSLSIIKGYIKNEVWIPSYAECQSNVLPTNHRYEPRSLKGETSSPKAGSSGCFGQPKYKRNESGVKSLRRKGCEVSLVDAGQLEQPR